MDAQCLQIFGQRLKELREEKSISQRASRNHWYIQGRGLLL